MAPMFGVLGFILPSVKPLIASLPKSSAIIKRIFGDCIKSTISFESSDLLQLIIINKVVNKQILAALAECL